MQLEKIITMGNEPVRIPLLAMIRSLRAVGCELPVWVIPYDERTFELPEGCSWWKDEQTCALLEAEKARPVMRKYQCMLEGNYQFVDSDIIFLRDPRPVLESHEGWVASCCHWNNPGHTYTEHSLPYIQRRSTTWQKDIFNTGQFACDRALYDRESFAQTATSQQYRRTILDDAFHEQPGINLLVHLSGVPISNLTLPPTRMESTWAGDYGQDYEHTWTDETRKPYLIHWAGEKMSPHKPISELFYQYLTDDERATFLAELEAKEQASPNKVKQKIRAAWKAMKDT
ncbi:MAG: hypothetical protein AAGF10_00770 [Verrucomicrobiota bacterium]